MQGKTLKKRLLFVGNDVTNPNSWSGTPYAIYTELIRQGVEVVTYNPYKWKQNRISNILVRILRKTILPSLGNELSVWDQLILSILIKRKLKKEGIDIVFYTTGNGASISCKKIKSYLLPML